MDNKFTSIFANYYKSDLKEEEFQQICDNSDLENGVLCFSGLGLAKKSIKVVIQILHAANDVTELDLSQSLLDNECLVTLFEALKTSANIEKLNANSNRLSHDAILALASMIKENSTMQKLSLQWCNLGENYEASQTLFTCIGHNACLEHLDLSNNGFMSSLGKSIALTGLRPNVSLRIIDLSWNKIGDNGASSILDVLKLNKNIQKVILDGNGVSSPMMTAIDSQLCNNVQLHLKHAEMMSKALAMTNELTTTKTRLSNDIHKLKLDYEDLQSRGAAHEESLLFEMGRLEDRLRDRNKEFGALIEKLALTTKALEVAEEKIEHLDMVDKARNEHFKELQDQCAAHEKSHREDWIQREQQLMTFAEEQSKAAHEAKLMTVKLQEDLSKEICLKNDLLEKVQQMKEEIGILKNTNAKFKNDVRSDHDKTLQELELRLKNANDEHKAELKETIEHKDKQMEIKTSEIERLKVKIVELKSRASQQSATHLKAIDSIRQDHISKIEEIQTDHFTEMNLSKAKLETMEKQQLSLKEELKTVKDVKNQIELSQERTNQENRELLAKVREFEQGKDHVRSIVRVEFEAKLVQGEKAIKDLEKSEGEIEALKSEVGTLQEQLKEMEKQSNENIRLLEQKLTDQQAELEKFKNDEKYRAQQLLEAVQLYAAVNMTK